LIFITQEKFLSKTLNASKSEQVLLNAPSNASVRFYSIQVKYNGKFLTSSFGIFKSYKTIHFFYRRGGSEITLALFHISTLNNYFFIPQIVLPAGHDLLITCSSNFHPTQASDQTVELNIFYEEMLI
jgi:hypothetical protein